MVMLKNHRDAKVSVVKNPSVISEVHLLILFIMHQNFSNTIITTLY